MLLYTARIALAWATSDWLNEGEFRVCLVLMVFLDFLSLNRGENASSFKGLASLVLTFISPVQAMAMWVLTYLLGMRRKHIKREIRSSRGTKALLYEEEQWGTCFKRHIPRWLVLLDEWLDCPMINHLNKVELMFKGQDLPEEAVQFGYGLNDNYESVAKNLCNTRFRRCMDPALLLIPFLLIACCALRPGFIVIMLMGLSTVASASHERVHEVRDAEDFRGPDGYYVVERHGLFGSRKIGFAMVLDGVLLSKIQSHVSVVVYSGVVYRTEPNGMYVHYKKVQLTTEHLFRRMVVLVAENITLNKARDAKKIESNDNTIISYSNTLAFCLRDIRYKQWLDKHPRGSETEGEDTPHYDSEEEPATIEHHERDPDDDRWPSDLDERSDHEPIEELEDARNTNHEPEARSTEVQKAVRRVLAEYWIFGKTLGYRLPRHMQTSSDLLKNLSKAMDAWVHLETDSPVRNMQ